MKASFYKRKKKTLGLAPGSLIHIGDKKTDEAILTIIRFDIDQISETTIKSSDEWPLFEENPGVTWINTEGLHQVDIVEKIGKQFCIHPLTLEDILDTDHRPKVEDFENHIFVMMKILAYDTRKEEILSEQISFILLKNTLLTFQERASDIFDPVQNRLHRTNSRIRQFGADFLLYSLMDIVVDNYFLVLEQIGAKIQEIEETLTDQPAQETLHTIHHLHREMLALRNAIMPLREVVLHLSRCDSTLLNNQSISYFQDIYDHTIQIIDMLENYRDIVNGIKDMYFSAVSTHLNSIMMVLTVIATIFIPLTFLVGVYGMNFEHMPELHWRWAYPVLWLVMISTAGGMLYVFKKNKWL